MPWKPRSPCSVTGCPHLSNGSGRCETHDAERIRARRAAYDANRPSAAKRGYDAEWQALRQRFLRAHPACSSCGQRATDVHHVHALARGGSNEWANLQALCHSCHSRITVRDMPSSYRPSYQPAMTDARKQFAIRDRPANRSGSVVIHLVGPPATGKTWFAYHLDNALGISMASIDAERIALGVKPGDDLAAWVALEDRLDCYSPVTCETAGVTPNDGPLLAGRHVYRIGCTASQPIRAQRLRQRPGYDDATIQRLLASATTPLPVDAWLDTTTPDADAVDRLTESVERWAMAARG
jgi:5-methylcytosine-specific restriction protein A